jgi:histidyl-tRNA synthetase
MKQEIMWKQWRNYGGHFTENGFEEMIIPALWEQETFVNKAGAEILNQMYTFNDKKGRSICLIPEVTAIIEQLYRESWESSKKKPIKVFYVSKCYRYEKPQEGRYREFTQFGVEILGCKDGTDSVLIEKILKQCLAQFKLDYRFNPSVKRGLDYYTAEGFEVECANLGAQKQIAGGGRYKSGIGFAIGVDRLILAKNRT